MAPNAKNMKKRALSISNSKPNTPTVVHRSNAIHKKGTSTFYDSWTLEWGHVKQKRLSIHVGDTLAFFSPKARLQDTQSSWHPFKERWSAAQVLALYFTDDCEFQMTVRWFYRYNKGEVKGISGWDKNKFTLPARNVITNSVMESATIGEVSVSNVLGRVVLTSHEEGFKEHFMRHHTSAKHNSVPQAGLLCQGYYDFEKRTFQQVDDWNGEGSYELSEPFMIRGIACLEKKESKIMMKLYMSNAPKRSSLAAQQQQQQAASSNKTTNSRKKLKATPAASSQSVASSSSVSTSKASKKHALPIASDDLESPVESNDEEDDEDCVEFLGNPLHKSAAGVKYYYQARLETAGAVFQVGDLVAVEWEYDSDTNKRRNSHKYFPFSKQWGAAQIISLRRPRKANAQLQMQIRWFYRLGDMSKQQKGLALDEDKRIGDLDVFETDELDMFPVSSILGSIAMMQPNQENKKSKRISGLPQAQLTCRYRVEKNGIVSVNDWENYDSNTLNDALKRGLKCLHYLIRPCTVAAIEHDPSDNEEEAMDYEDEDKDEGDYSEEEHSRSKIPTVSPGDLVKEADDGQIYYLKVSVPVQLGKCVSRFVTKTRSEKWELCVGDVVCVEKENAEMPVSSERTSSGLWHPFQVPWSCCQILSIYTRAAEDDILVEVRWFLRASSIDNPALEDPRRDKEEILETFLVSPDIPAASILGKVHLKLGHHTQSGDLKSAANSSTIPTVNRQCKSLYFDQVRRTQPIFCSDTNPRKWHRRLLERGFKASQILQLDEDLRGMIDILLGCEQSIDINPFADLQADAPINEGVRMPSLWSDDTSALLLKTSIQPPWHHYVEADKVCHIDDRPRQMWSITVGDIVAAKKKDANEPVAFEETIWFPYNVRWAPCQVVAIFQREGKVSFEVRWLLLSQSASCDHIYEDNQCATGQCDEEAMLGPLTIPSLRPQVSPPFLPLSIHIYKSTEATSTSGEFTPFAAMVERGIATSTIYESRVERSHVVQKVLELLSLDDVDPSHAGREAASPISRANARDDQRNVIDTINTFANENQSVDDFASHTVEAVSGTVYSPAGWSAAKSVRNDVQSPLDSGHRISTTSAPIHVDKSALREYFTEMVIEPSLNLYEDNGTTNDKAWQIELGDIVVLHHQHGAGTKYPHKVNWAIAEIVAIWKAYETKKDFSGRKKRTKRKTSTRQMGDLELEIRWFWRRCELPGQDSKKNDEEESEEIFETDHIDRCTAASILAPARVHFSKEHITGPGYHLGKKIQEFRCSRFWSYHRRSIIPFASVDGMKARSRMYSTCFTKDTVLLGKLEKAEKKYGSLTGQIEPPVENFAPTWKKSFQTAIDKLSLTQASEDAFGKSVILIGRQHEQSVIKKFLRTSIEAGHESSSGGTACPSMFVSGPPGTGKSVSVCSIVARLRHEQIQGKLPDFDFVSLNGMEMRHPFEAYVKFWEAISGHAKERLNPEVAAAKLERYFTGMPVTNAPERSVVVLMLDEIDFLVTKKQTVVYNFFDWPKRSFDAPNSPRLIVIGISNTVNLPSQLKQSVSSRLGSSRCDFKAYNAKDIVKILTSKIQPKQSSYAVFEKDAIILAARKVASVTGDIRQALQFCKTAAEVVMQEVENGTRDEPKSTASRPMVRCRDIGKVFREKFGSVMSQAIAASSPLEVLLLVSLAALSHNSGRSGGHDIVEVMTKTASVASSSGVPAYNPPPSFQEMLDMLNRLAEARLVSLRTETSSMTTFRASQGGSGGAWPSIALNVDSFDILSALRSTVHSQLAQKQLPVL